MQAFSQSLGMRVAAEMVGGNRQISVFVGNALLGILLSYSLTVHPLAHIRIHHVPFVFQAKFQRPFLLDWIKISRHRSLRLCGGALETIPDQSESEADGESSDGSSNEEEEEEEESWLKYVPEDPDDDPELKASFEELGQAIIDAGYICNVSFLLPSRLIFCTGRQSTSTFNH